MKKENLFQQLSRLRHDYRHDKIILFSMLTGCVVAALLFIGVLADLLLHLPQFACWLWWLLMLALAVSGIYLVCRTARQRLSNAAVARLIEQVVPDNQNHLINAVQLSEYVAGSEKIVDELLSETKVALETVQSHQLYNRRPVKWLRWSMAALIFIALGLLLLTPQGTLHAMARLVAPMAGIRPFTLTQIDAVTPGDSTVLRGDSLNISVSFSGRRPESPRILFQRGRGKVEEMRLSHVVAENGQAVENLAYQGELSNLFYDSKYRIIGGDIQSNWFNIRVTNPPGLEHWEAKITPPQHVGLEPYRISSSDTDGEVPVGSEIVLGGAANAPLHSVSIMQDKQLLAEKLNVGREKFAVKFHLQDGGPVVLQLKSDSTLESSTTLPFIIKVDQPPLIQLVDTEQRIAAAKDAQIPVNFRATDDYGVSRVGIEQLDDQNGVLQQIAEAVPEQPQTTFNGRFIVDMASFEIARGGALRLRLWAEDNGLAARERRGRSVVFQVFLPRAEEEREVKKAVAQQSRDSVLALIKLQRENLKNTRQLTEQLMLTREMPEERLQETHQAQKNIRDIAVSLLSARAALGDLAMVISGLVNHEMSQVLEVFDAVYRSKMPQAIEKLNLCIRLETQILAALTGIPLGLAAEQQHQEKTDLLAALQKLVAGQRQNLNASKIAQKEAREDVRELLALAAVEDGLAAELITFTDHCLIFINARTDDDFAKQLREAYDLIEKGNVYEKMLNAAEALETADLPGAVQGQEEVLRILLQALDVLNVWRVKNAEKIVKEATAVLEEVAKKLGELESKQAVIAEVTRDLAKRGRLDDEVREKLREMDEEQKEMAEMIEQLAQDLYQFPELPVCNELNSKMREIYEDVEQAMDSENTPALEIAVQKEDALLDAIRNTKERVEDVEMWLPDVPDNIVWNMESFDTDEFPDIPLVPLPDELEDLVGELLDQAASIEAESQDTTGNNLLADGEMGWGVMDGPMPSFAAKGKSGNMRPNDNEMTGRSGAGREGQATGELVENHVKGLEGRQTHARRTRDPFQKGMVTEDEHSTLDARSTGGGKLGGESESIGMFGNAPRRDLHVPDHGMAPTQLRRETEALYATARLLYLGTGSLGHAARELRGIESAPEKMKSFGSLHRRVVRRLEDTQLELSGGVILPMPVTSVSKTGGAVIDDMDINQISEEYRELVSDYYRSLDK